MRRLVLVACRTLPYKALRQCDPVLKLTRKSRAAKEGYGEDSGGIQGSTRFSSVLIRLQVHIQIILPRCHIKLKMLVFLDDLHSKIGGVDVGQICHCELVNDNLFVQYIHGSCMSLTVDI